MSSRLALALACCLCLLWCARADCSARSRVPDMYNNATMGLGVPSGRGVPRGGPPARTCGPLGTRLLGTQEK